MSADQVIDFERGLEAGLDPQPDDQRDVSGEAVTSLNSWWHYRRCSTCGHTFRRGDRVLIRQEPGVARVVGHLDPVLDCAADQASEITASAAELAAFAEGLLAAWPPSEDLPITSLDAGDSRLAKPVGHFERSKCMFCAHTFRRGELVIVCPCQPSGPFCDAAVHRDPARGLVCWESWRPANRMSVCPIFLTRLDG